jgi:hypothetical protein
LPATRVSAFPPRRGPTEAPQPGPDGQSPYKTTEAI